MDPTGPSQPSLNTAYDHPSNPAQSSQEHQSSTTTRASQSRSGPTFSSRQPNDVSTDATPSSLGYGVQSDKYDAGESMGRAAEELDAEQMRAAGEGDIASRQEHKGEFGSGSGGTEKGFTEGLGRKKEEQQELKRERGYGSGVAGEGTQHNEGRATGEGKVDVAGAVGGEGKGFVGAKREQGRETGGGVQADHTHV